MQLLLKEWRLKNFKSVRTGSFGLEPSGQSSDGEGLALDNLTVLAGANSSGKSSIIQSILLVAQTLRSRQNPGVLQIQDGLIRLGGFDQVFSFWSDTLKPEDRVMEIGWSLGPDLLDRNVPHPISCDFHFDDLDSGEHHDPNLFPPLKWARIGFSAKGDEPYEVRLERRGEGGNKGYKVTIEPTFASRQLLEQHEIGAITDCRLANILPEAVQFSFDALAEEAEFVISVLTHNFRYPLKITERLTRMYQDPLFEMTIPETVLDPTYLGTHEFVTALARPVSPWEWLRNLWLAYGQSFGVPPRSAALSGEEESPGEKWKSLRETVKANKGPIELKVREGLRSRAVNLLDEAKLAELGDRPLPEMLAKAVDYLKKDFAEGIHYLGPLREPPKQIYPFSGGLDSRDVGLSGEHTPYVLLRHSGEWIDYIPAENLDQFTNWDEAPELWQKATLNTAVDKWLQYIGAAQGVKVSPFENLGIELRVIMDGPLDEEAEEIIEEDDEPGFSEKEWTPARGDNMAGDKHPPQIEQVGKPKEEPINSSGELQGFYLNQVGVGVSQVLPILVMCLLQKKGSILLLEQPELHLHPKVQSRLADFFITMGLLGKQCIVETHGEHWINRLQLLIARSKGGQIAEKTKVYFVSRRAGLSHFMPVKINRYGTIEDWPDDFCDQHLENVARMKAGWEKMKDEETETGS